MSTEPGSSIIAGRYSVGREIGRGGTGAVYAGRDTLLGRDVALKRVGLQPGSQAADVERVMREARLSAALNHPNVIAVFDLVDDGLEHWLVIEYVDGQTLSQLAGMAGMTPEELAPIARQAADALAAAHRAGIVHRDVKPSNILITRDGVVKLTDFGIARGVSDSSLTQTGLVTGSPAYLAPEVASGQRSTAASDVWSFGASVFHALTGRPPYETRENVLGTLYQIVNEPPPTAQTAGWLAPLLRHTMAKDPAERWTMDQVIAFLDRATPEETAVIPTHPAFVSGGGRSAEDPPEDQPKEQATQALQAMLADSVTDGGSTAQGGPILGSGHGGGPSRREGGPGGRRRGPWGRVVALLTLLILALVAWLAFTIMDRQTDRSAGPNGGTPSGVPSGTASTPAAQRPTVAGMTAFVEDYLGTVTDDPGTTWERLTPAFQEKSSGFDSYRDFWNRIDTATPSRIVADPAQMQVSYVVDYVLKRSNERQRDEVTLLLEYDGGRYRIADETS